MPLRWISPPSPASSQSPLGPEEPKIVLVAPGSLTPRHRLSTVLAAGSLLAVALRPLPRPQLPRALASPFVVTNTSAAGPGSLFQAVQDANANAGAAAIAFQSGLTGTIALTETLLVTNSVTITGPGPGALSVSGGNSLRVFYLSNPSSSPLTATISGLTIRDGYDIGGGAGLRAKNFDLIVDQVDLISNSTKFGGGAGLDFKPKGPITVSLTIRDSLVSGNRALAGGGLRVYLYQSTADVTITNTQIVSNTAFERGGGAFIVRPSHLVIEDSTIAGNTAPNGGGTYLYRPANLLIQDTTIAGNTAGQSGGGINMHYIGGGSNTIRRTTISGNTAAIGGGVYLYKLSSPLSIENTTLSGNHAGQGAGVYLTNSSTGTSIQNSTIVSNTAGSSGGGIRNGAMVLPITDTIVAGNVAPLGPDISGTFQLRYDLVQVTGTATISDAGGNLFGLDPLLGPLADNGGPTHTHLPAHTSPVVNAGDPAFAPPPTTDQRGRLRVMDGRIDIGSVEIPGELFLPLIRR